MARKNLPKPGKTFILAGDSGFVSSISWPQGGENLGAGASPCFLIQFPRFKTRATTVGRQLNEDRPAGGRIRRDSRNIREFKK
jgi:hypothetical protein